MDLLFIAARISHLELFLEMVIGMQLATVRHFRIKLKSI